MEQNNKIVLFQDKQIRRVWHNEKWYFSVVDIVGILSGSSQPNRYWADIKKRSLKESNQPFAFCEQLKMKAGDGKERLTDVTDTEGVLRIIMSIPSPNAEPFRLWLAQVGREHLEEIENPELGFERMTEIYKAKGYTDEWIKNRMQSIETRKRLTDEWKGRGVKEGQEYSILTATIAKGTFGMTPSEHGKMKGLERENLRDHMSPLELIFTALSEEATRIYAEKDNANGFNENHEAAQKGGETTGETRKLFEKRTGQKVVSSDNFLKQIEEYQKKGELPEEDAINTDGKL
jgi:DNA-damage-inducible protein D